MKGGWRIYSNGPGIYLNQLVTAVLGIRQKAQGMVFDPMLPEKLSGLTLAYQLSDKPTTRKLYLNQSTKIVIDGQETPFKFEENPYREGGMEIQKDEVLSLLNEANVIEVYHQRGEQSVVGIKDIAKKTGVSISTVSYALNGNSKVTEETRMRIQAVAEELNYIPSMAARILKRRRTNVTGVYLADCGGSFYGELLERIKKGLTLFDYEMVTRSGKKSHLFILEKMVDGTVILDQTFPAKEVEKLAECGHSTVALDRTTRHRNIWQVLLGSCGDATQAVEQFVNVGSRKVLLLSGSEEGYDNQERLAIGTRELARSRIPHEVIQGDFTESSDYAVAKKISGQPRTEPINVFAFNDKMAIGVHKHVIETNCQMGKDIRMIGFDNSELDVLVQPRLAIVAYSKHRWGMVAAEKVTHLMRGEAAESEHIHTYFIEGESLPSK